ncbi:hypothetical protein GGE45_005720 [Rhizobium aethiopicum]|uniref:Uncharacterized protein n=1 Tax=Rhizobium aethiopicum TaxID=1138170 RepID=A0A7W6VSL4_9HYPH|nr:hypothetical protein [Rhizobium aethiopicum]MBB4583350.1 hypothetical protein [Rhizobium aethiopicum]
MCAVSLDGWKLEDENGRTQTLSGTLAAGELRTIALNAAAGGPQLANRGGATPTERSPTASATARARPRTRSGRRFFDWRLRLLVCQAWQWKDKLLNPSL